MSYPNNGPITQQPGFPPQPQAPQGQPQAPQQPQQGQPQAPQQPQQGQPQAPQQQYAPQGQPQYAPQAPQQYAQQPQGPPQQQPRAGGHEDGFFGSTRMADVEDQIEKGGYIDRVGTYVFEVMQTKKVESKQSMGTRIAVVNFEVVQTLSGAPFLDGELLGKVMYLDKSYGWRELKGVSAGIVGVPQSDFTNDLLAAVFNQGGAGVRGTLVECRATQGKNISKKTGLPFIETTWRHVARPNETDHPMAQYARARKANPATHVQARPPKPPQVVVQQQVNPYAQAAPQIPAQYAQPMQPQGVQHVPYAPPMPPHAQGQPAPPMAPQQYAPPMAPQGQPQYAPPQQGQYAQPPQGHPQQQQAPAQQQPWVPQPPAIGNDDIPF